MHLVRHAAHGLLGRVLTGRMEGVELSAEGHEQAARLAETLGSRGGVTAVVSSPVQRAMETAAPVAVRCGLEVVIEPGLAEIDFGAWTGRSFLELEGDPGWDAWNRNRGVAGCPGGETMLAAQARAVAAMHRLAAEGGELVLVSHQDVLKSLIAHVLGASLDLLHRFAFDPAHRATVTFTAGGARVESLNVPP